MLGITKNLLLIALGLPFHAVHVSRLVIPLVFAIGGRS